VSAAVMVGPPVACILNVQEIFSAIDRTPYEPYTG
jgi:hypothetical protein